MVVDSGLPVAVVLIFPLYFLCNLISAVCCRDKGMLKPYVAAFRNAGNWLLLA
jgi:hypothetical protein